MRFFFWRRRPANALSRVHSFQIPDLPTSEDDEDPFYDARSCNGHSEDASFYSARAAGSTAGSLASFSAAASNADEQINHIDDTECMDDPLVFQDERQQKTQDGGSGHCSNEPHAHPDIDSSDLPAGKRTRSFIWEGAKLVIGPEGASLLPLRYNRGGQQLPAPARAAAASQLPSPPTQLLSASPPTMLLSLQIQAVDHDDEARQLTGGPHPCVKVMLVPIKEQQACGSQPQLFVFGGESAGAGAPAALPPRRALRVTDDTFPDALGPGAPAGPLPMRDDQPLLLQLGGADNAANVLSPSIATACLDSGRDSLPPPAFDDQDAKSAVASTAASKHLKASASAKQPSGPLDSNLDRDILNMSALLSAACSDPAGRMAGLMASNPVIVYDVTLANAGQTAMLSSPRQQQLLGATSSPRLQLRHQHREMNSPGVVDVAISPRSVGYQLTLQGSPRTTLLHSPGQHYISPALSPREDLTAAILMMTRYGSPHHTDDGDAAGALGKGGQLATVGASGKRGPLGTDKASVKSSPMDVEDNSAAVSANGSPLGTVGASVKSSPLDSEDNSVIDMMIEEMLDLGNVEAEVPMEPFAGLESSSSSGPLLGIACAAEPVVAAAAPASAVCAPAGSATAGTVSAAPAFAVCAPAGSASADTVSAAIAKAATAILAPAAAPCPAAEALSFGTTVLSPASASARGAANADAAPACTLPIERARGTLEHIVRKLLPGYSCTSSSSCSSESETAIGRKLLPGHSSASLSCSSESQGAVVSADSLPMPATAAEELPSVAAAAAEGPSAAEGEAGAADEPLTEMVAATAEDLSTAGVATTAAAGDEQSVAVSADEPSAAAERVGEVVRKINQEQIEAAAAAEDLSARAVEEPLKAAEHVEEAHQPKQEQSGEDKEARLLQQAKALPVQDLQRQAHGPETDTTPAVPAEAMDAETRAFLAARQLQPPLPICAAELVKEGQLAAGSPAAGSAMRKRKAEITVYPEDEGHWAPDAPGMRLNQAHEARLQAGGTATVLLELLEVELQAGNATEVQLGNMEPELTAVIQRQQTTERGFLPAQAAASGMKGEGAAGIEAAAPTAAVAAGLASWQRLTSDRDEVVEVAVYQMGARRHDGFAPLEAHCRRAAGADTHSGLVLPVRRLSEFEVGAVDNDSTKKKAAGFFKTLFKGCIYPRVKRWDLGMAE